MGRARNPYDVFARVYDAWQAGFTRPFSAAILPFYEREILSRAIPERSLADIACGTGTFLLAWNRAHPGWRLVGTDASAGMLAAARRKGTPGRLIRVPMQETRLPAPVGAAVCVFDSVNHLTRTADLRRAFRSIAATLLPGGLFLFDLNDERAFARLFSGSWTIQSPGLFVSVTATSEGSTGSSRFVIFSRISRGVREAWSRSDLTIRERNWTAGEIRSAIGGAGLELLRTRRIRPYPPDQVDSPRTLWICRRPARPGNVLSSKSLESWRSP